MVMGKTNIEALVPLTVPVPELAAPSSATSGQDRPAFGDHLRQLEAASQSREPARRPTAPEERKEAQAPAASGAPTGDADKPDQAPPATTNDDSEQAQTKQAAEPKAEQDSSDAQSENVPTDDDATDAASPMDEQNDRNDDPSEDGNAVKAIAAAAASQVLVVQAVDEVNPPAEDANSDQAAAENVDPIEPEQDAQRRSKTTGDAKRLSAEPAAVIAADEQPANTTEAADDLASEPTDKPSAAPTADHADDEVQTKHQEQPAAGKAAIVQTKDAQQRHADADVPPAARRRDELQTDQRAPDEPRNAPRHEESQPPRTGRQEDAKPVKPDVKHPSTGKRADAAATRSPVQPGPPATTAPGASGTNEAAVASAVTAEGGREARLQTSPTDDAGSRPREQADHSSGRAEGLLTSLSRFHRGSAATGHGSRTGEGQEMPRVDAARFVGRVARALELAGQRGGTLHLRLSPPELGSLRLELTVKQGVMTASLETETAAARQTLLHHLPALRERLAEQNIRVERFDVDVRRDGSGGQSSAGPRQQPQETSHAGAAVRPSRVTAEAVEETPIVGPRIDSTGINLIA